MLTIWCRCIFAGSTRGKKKYTDRSAAKDSRPRTLDIIFGRSKAPVVFSNVRKTPRPAHSTSSVSPPPISPPGPSIASSLSPVPPSPRGNNTFISEDLPGDTPPPPEDLSCGATSRVQTQEPGPVPPVGEPVPPASEKTAKPKTGKQAQDKWPVLPRGKKAKDIVQAQEPAQTQEVVELDEEEDLAPPPKSTLR